MTGHKRASRGGRPLIPCMMPPAAKPTNGHRKSPCHSQWSSARVSGVRK